MVGEIYKDTPASGYTPSQDVIDLTKEAQKKYSLGSEILNKPWTQLNNYSVIDRMNKDRKTFNSFVDESVEDPNQAWRWRGTRSMAANRARAVHAHLTASYILPMVYAQNEAQKEDRDMGDVMRDILEWMSMNSNYRQSFLGVTQMMLVDPVSYLGGDFLEQYQTIKEKTDKGYAKKEVLDHVLSGFQTGVYSANQVLITNAFQQNMQRQSHIIERNYIDYEEAEVKYGKHENWGHVRRGIRTIFNNEDGLFYDIYDTENQNLVEECIVKCRREDYEIPFVNGIYFGDSDVEANPIKHRDNYGAPKYNKVPFGYHRIDEHFFFYKSLMNVVGWDNDLLDAMYQIGMNKAILDTEAPVVVTGEDSLSSGIVFPGSVVVFESNETKVSPLLPQTNNSVLSAMPVVEKSIQEGTISDTAMGQLPKASQKAYTVQRAEQNSKVIFSAVFKSIGISMIQFGELMVDIALQHLTVAEIDEISSNLNYKTFTIQNQKIGGKSVSKSIRFDPTLMGAEMSEEDKKKKNLSLLKEAGYPDVKEHLYDVNPVVFSKMKYYLRVEPEMMKEKNEAYEQAVSMQMYSLLRQDPLIDPEILVRELLHSFKHRDVDEFMAKNTAQPMLSGAGGATPQSELGAQFNAKQLSNIVAET